MITGTDVMAGAEAATASPHPPTPIRVLHQIQSIYISIYLFIYILYVK